MTVLAAADLDRTLVYSRAALALGEAVADPVCVETHDGRPAGFMTATALAGLAVVSRRATFVPVTTRTVAQLARIVLPGVRHRYAVATNGARLLVDGVLDPDWERTVGRTLAGVPGLDRVETALAPLLDRPWVLRRHRAEDVFGYAVVDRGAVPADWVGELGRRSESWGWRASVQGRKVYVLPAALTKQAAIAEVARRTGATTVLAAGDSLLDRELLAAADVAVRPAHGELHDAGWTCPGLRVTARAGARAAEDVVAIMAAVVDGADAGRGLGCRDQSREPAREAL